LKLKELTKKFAVRKVFYFKEEVLFRIFITIISFIFLLIVSYVVIFTFSHLNFILIIFGLILFGYFLSNIMEYHQVKQSIQINDELYKRENEFLNEIESNIMILLEEGAIMTNRLTEPLNKELHLESKKQIKNYILNFAISLVTQSKILAFRKQHEVVLKNDVKDAFDIIKIKSREKHKQYYLILGSAFIGAFLPGISTELFGGNNLDRYMITIYILVGFLGLILINKGLNE